MLVKGRPIGTPFFLLKRVDHRVTCAGTLGTTPYLTGRRFEHGPRRALVQRAHRPREYTQAAPQCDGSIRRVAQCMP